MAGFIILGVKKWTFFRLISIESEELSLIQKDNSLTFFMRQKEGNVFFKICHFLITGRVVLHKKFYKKFHLPVIKNGRLFRQKNFFLVAGFIILGVKKWTFFRLISIESEELSFNSKKIILWHFFYATKEGTFFKNLSLFDNWSCSTTQEIL